jgi:hypothetical protein
MPHAILQNGHSRRIDTDESAPAEATTKLGHEAEAVRITRLGRGRVTDFITIA